MCNQHGQCGSDEYCDTNNVCFACTFVLRDGRLGSCHSYNDAVDGTCPMKCGAASCTNHTDCRDSDYCDTSNLCYGCSLSVTRSDGTRVETTCQELGDAIDGTCPSKCPDPTTPAPECSAHTECSSSSANPECK